MAEDIVSLGQDPFLEFPASNISSYQRHARRRAAPDDALPRLLRAAGRAAAEHHASRPTPGRANAIRPLPASSTSSPTASCSSSTAPGPTPARSPSTIARPRTGSRAMSGAVAGIGSEPWLDRDSVEDIAKLPFAMLTGASVKSASRLRQLIRGIFDVERGDRGTHRQLAHLRAGRLHGAGHGRLDAGRRHLPRPARLLDQRQDPQSPSGHETWSNIGSFLPTGELSDKLADLIFFYVGHRVEFDVELALAGAAGAARPTRRLGRTRLDRLDFALGGRRPKRKPT